MKAPVLSWTVASSAERGREEGFNHACTVYSPRLSSQLSHSTSSGEEKGQGALLGKDLHIEQVE